MIREQFTSITKEGRNLLLQSLETVWKKHEDETAQEALQLRQRIKNANEIINRKIDAIVDPENVNIKDHLRDQVAKHKEEILGFEDQLDELIAQKDANHEEFLKFALDFIDNMGVHFLEISQENRLRCKQIVFPAGFRLDSHGKVYTPEISPLYRLASMKKARTINVQAHLVRVTGL